MIDYFLFDLDGTVTMEELLPRIASAVGVADQICELTSKTLAGEIPFEYSLRHRVDILKVATISEVRKIIAGVELNPDILAFIKKNKERCCIVTGNLDAWITDLIDFIDVPVLCSTVEVKNDKIIEISEILDKKKAASSFNGKICVIGEGANDYGMFEVADISIAYGGVHEPARQLLEIATHLTYNGGALCKMLSQL